MQGQSSFLAYCWTLNRGRYACVSAGSCWPVEESSIVTWNCATARHLLMKLRSERASGCKCITSPRYGGGVVFSITTHPGGNVVGMIIDAWVWIVLELVQLRVSVVICVGLGVEGLCVFDR